MSPRPTKSDGKGDTLAEHRREQRDVLRRGDAAEQHDLGLAPGRRERLEVPDEGPPVARLVDVDLDAGVALEVRHPQRRSGGTSPSHGVITWMPEAPCGGRAKARA